MLALPHSLRLQFPPQISGSKTSARQPSLSTASVRFRPPAAAAAATAEKAASSSSHSFLYPPRPASPSSSLYEILGLPIGATVPEIKAAYRRLARICHPDVAGDDRKEFSTGEFIKIREAYATLSDQEKRSAYDRRRFRSYDGISGYAAAISSFAGYTCRNWETDQCW